MTDQDLLKHITVLAFYYQKARLGYMYVSLNPQTPQFYLLLSV